jgi:hypothetical protein
LGQADGRRVRPLRRRHRRRDHPVAEVTQSRSEEMAK